MRRHIGENDGRWSLPEECCCLLVPVGELVPAPAPPQQAHRLQVTTVQHQHPTHTHTYSTKINFVTNLYLKSCVSNISMEIYLSTVNGVYMLVVNN